MQVDLKTTWGHVRSFISSALILIAAGLLVFGALSVIGVTWSLRFEPTALRDYGLFLAAIAFAVRYK